MSKLPIATLAVAGLASFAAPAVFAAPASAAITNLTIEGATAGSDCKVGAASCRIVVKVSDYQPVLVKVGNDVVAYNVTPSNGAVVVEWNPPANGKYNVSALQGKSVAQLIVGVPGRADSDSATEPTPSDFIESLLSGSAG
ncbi:hypothetical protein ABZ319_26120 [Nocardia sp. NPDC005978]|uniref:hypothetical protein n=1 Tax=Nocardia sp. NPDC005978 TaxID=3156725 RepID=UPI0033A841AA